MINAPTEAKIALIPGGPKLIPTPYTLAKLKEAGQRAADDFLQSHKKDINTRSSVDLVEMFQ